MALSFDKKRLILCEGGSDKGFFSELIRARSLPEFQIQFPIKGSDKSGGWQKFGYFLREIQINEGFIKNVEAILVIADNDDDPAARFIEIQNQISSAGYNAPRAPLEIAKTASLPAIAILMIPIGTMGNLETLLLAPAYAKWPIEAALDDYIRHTPCATWPQRKTSKARMHCVLAATCMQDPNTPLSLLWKDRAPEYHIPLDHVSLTPIADALANFSASL